MKENQYRNEQTMDPKTCGICMDDINNESHQFLECMHGYHISCIGTWLVSDNILSDKCPICKTDILNELRISILQKVPQKPMTSVEELREFIATDTRDGQEQMHDFDNDNGDICYFDDGDICYFDESE